VISLKDAIEVLKLGNTEFAKGCRIVNYQASGPGGQKRNRKLSAVRLSHVKSNITVTAAEFRETHRNLIIAVSKLRLEIALKTEISGLGIDDKLLETITFKYDINEKKPDFQFSVLKTFYYFRQNSASVRETAKDLKISSHKLIKFLKKNKQVWQETQEIRKKNGHTPLNR